MYLDDEWGAPRSGARASWPARRGSSPSPCLKNPSCEHALLGTGSAASTALLKNISWSGSASPSGWGPSPNHLSEMFASDLAKWKSRRIWHFIKIVCARFFSKSSVLLLLCYRLRNLMFRAFSRLFRKMLLCRAERKIVEN